MVFAWQNTLRFFMVPVLAVTALALEPVTAAHAAVPLAIDQLVAKHQTPAASVTTAAFSTHQTGELLLAFIGADGPSNRAQTVSGVTGASLTWTLRQRSNTQSGTSEIWQARATTILTNVTVRANLSSAASSSLVVASFTGADPTANGAVATANAPTGAPTVALTTTRAGGWVWGVGSDWDSATARTAGANQTKVDEYLSTVGDTYWVQRQSAATASAGTSVAINDTAPTADRWNLAAIEILPATTDNTAPSAPTNLAATTPTPNQVSLTWSASTDDIGVAGYQVWRNGQQLATTSATSFNDLNATANTTYTYTARAYDAAGNVSPDSNAVQVVTPAPDTTAPAISAISVTGITQSTATISWTTDEASDSTVEYGPTTAYGTSSPTNGGLVTSHSVALSGLSAASDYHFRVKSKDVAGNLGTSADNGFTTTAPVGDTTPPTVSVSGPAAGSTVSATVTVTASAADNVGVVGVQFKLDGAVLGSEDLSSPYSASWNTTMSANGNHNLTAVARDSAGNTTTSATVSVTVNNGGSDPSQIGQWSAPIPLPAVAIHSALLPNGKILLWQGDFTQGGQQYVFDPTTNTTTQVPNAKADLFCAGQAVMADGRVLVIGGTATDGGFGVNDITAFNYDTQTWTALAPMQRKRWYATGTTLSDGKVLVTSGSDTSETDVVAESELYSPSTNTWQTLADNTHVMPIYPFIYQLPDGRIVHLGGSEGPTKSEVMNLSTAQWTTFDSRIIEGGSIANYAPNKFIKAGSAADDGFSGNSVNTAFTLDMSQPGATWQPTSSMQFPRSFLNLTNLPDGTVLATGGDTDKTGFNDAHAVLAAENWDPATGQWKTLASMTTPRLYHSVAVLLPDGRVYTAGGGGDPGVPDHKDTQIYSPPYLFKGARPTITSAPSTPQYNSNAFVATPDAAAITKVTLIRTGSVTHAFDENARALSLNFSVTAGGLNVQMPQNGNYAPPGYYLLSIVNGNGVPSISSYVRLPAPYEDNIAPTAPASLSANGVIGAANLSWPAATDNVGVTQYNVYRSTTSNFTAGPANQIGQTASTTFTDTAPAGTYYYQVTAQDAVGNIGAPSPEASATILTDSTPPSAPSALTVTSTTTAAVGLSWTASTDNVSVTGYQVWRNSTLVATIGASTAYSDATVAANTAYTYTVRALDAAGNGSLDSNPVTTTTPATSSLSIDKVVSTHQSTAASTISAPAFSTAGPNELLVAFITSDGGTTQTISGVSGGGLTWTLRQRTNARAGTSEIWQAVAPSTLTNVTVTATRSSGSYQGAITVASFIGANTSVNGAVATANAASGAPSIKLTTTRANSMVWAVGNDWDNATARTVGTGQTKVDEFLAPAGDTFWVQRQTALTPTAGTVVTMNDTAPTADRWNFSAIEIPGS